MAILFTLVLEKVVMITTSLTNKAHVLVIRPKEYNQRSDYGSKLNEKKSAYDLG